MSDDPIEALKRELGADVARLTAGWNAWDIAVLMGTDQPRVSDLRRGKFARFSVTALLRFLHRLNQRIEIRLMDESLWRPPRPQPRTYIVRSRKELRLEQRKKTS